MRKSLILLLGAVGCGGNNQGSSIHVPPSQCPNLVTAIVSSRDNRDIDVIGTGPNGTRLVLGTVSPGTTSRFSLPVSRYFVSTKVSGLMLQDVGRAPMVNVRYECEQ